MLGAGEQMARTADEHRHRLQEYAALVVGFEVRMRERSMPPEDAQAWAHIILEQAESIGLLTRGWDAVDGAAKPTAR